MIFGDLGGLKLPDMCLTGEENPEKTSPRKPVLTGDRTRARCVIGAHAAAWPTAVDARRLATGWTARVQSRVSEGWIVSFVPSCPDWSWGPLSLLWNEYRGLSPSVGLPPYLFLVSWLCICVDRCIHIPHEPSWPVMGKSSSLCSVYSTPTKLCYCRLLSIQGDSWRMSLLQGIDLSCHADEKSSYEYGSDFQ